MMSSPPSMDTQINTSGTSVPPINPPINPSETADPLTSLPPRVIFNAQHTGASSQNPLGIYWLPASAPGVNLPYTEPIHHSSRSLPFIPPFPELHTPNINTVHQTPNFTPSSKETMKKNIQMQMALMQQQLDALNQDENVKNWETTTTPSRSSTKRSEGSCGRKMVRKDKKEESSSINILEYHLVTI